MKITLRQPYSFYQKGRRGNQEDARYPDCDKPKGEPRTFVVCDGVGGQDKGEVASRTVAGAIGEYMQRADLSQEFTTAELTLVLDYAYRALNNRMAHDTREMATTLTFLCFHSGGVMASHMGDSRIYQIRPEVGIIYRSADHSLVNALVHSGVITPQEAINHPQKNVITRCMGYVAPGHDRPTAATMEITDVQPGDYFFMCTDGVLDKVSDEKLVEVILADKSDEWKIGELARLSADSSDNNTAYLIGVESVTFDHETDDSTGPVYGEEMDMIDIDNPAADTADEISHTTRPLDKKPEEIAEISAEGKSVKSKISSFFKKLFG